MPPNLNYLFHGFQGHKIHGVEEFKTGHVVEMKALFSDTAKFNQSLKLWDMGMVKSFEGMFDDAVSFDADINSWNISKALSLRSMFERCQYQQPVDGGG